MVSYSDGVTSATLIDSVTPATTRDLMWWRIYAVVFHSNFCGAQVTHYKIVTIYMLLLPLSKSDLDSHITHSC